MKEESEKVGLNLNIQKIKITSSGPISSWQIDGFFYWKQCQTLFWRAPKLLQMVISAMKWKDTCSLECPSSQGYGFSSSLVWMWESDYKQRWVLNNWCFWTVVLEKTRVPWAARRSNQSILKETSPGCSLEGLILKLRLQYFGHLMWRADSFETPWCWERLRAGGEGDDRGWDSWMASPTRWT